MKSFSWDNIDVLTDWQISYLLYTEGKDIKTICRIRDLDRSDVEKHIIEGKIKYRIYEGINSTEDILKKLMKYRREERINFLSSMTEEEKKGLEKHASEKLFDSSRDECNFYIWLLGELKSSMAVPGLVTFLKCTDGNVKRMCCSALGKIGDIRAEDGLINCLGDQRPQIREYAVKALGRIKSKKSLGVLNKILNSQKEKDYVVKAAKTAIEQIEEKGEVND